MKHDQYFKTAIVRLRKTVDFAYDRARSYSESECGVEDVVVGLWRVVVRL